MSFCIQSIRRGENAIVQRQDKLRIRNARSPDFDTIAIDISCLVRAADDHGHWTAGKFVRTPFELASSNWLALLAALREEQTRMDRFDGCGMLVSDDHCRAFHSDAEEQFRKFQREPDAAVRVWIPRQVACVQRNPAPSHALHVTHLGSFINTRRVVHLLFQDCENTRRSSMTRPVRANTRPRDADTITIHICHLISNAGYDQ